MDGLPSQWDNWIAQAKAFELQLDDLGDATHLLIERTVKSDQRLRLEQEVQERVQHIAGDLRAIAVVVDDAYNLSRYLRVVKHQEEAS